MIINDLKSVFKSIKFWSFILFMLLINVYGIFLNAPQINPFSNAYIETQYAIESGYLNQFSLFTYASNFQYLNFIPIVCAFIYGLSFLHERKKGFNIFINCRISNKRYCINKFITNGIIGGISVSLPTIIIFYILNVFIGGNINDTGMACGGIFHDFMMDNPYMYILLFIFFEFIVGFAYSTVALATSTLLNSEILVLLSPGIFYYVSNYITEIMSFPLALKTKIATEFGILASGVNGYELVMQIIIITIIFASIFFYHARKEFMYEQ